MAPASGITTALAMAMDGATIWLDAGRYPVDETLMHVWPVNLRSLFGREETILDGLEERTVIQMWNPDAELEGVTILNGRGTLGGGVSAFSAGRLRDVAVISNVAHSGGGVFGVAGLDVRDSVFAYNRTTNQTGGGLFTSGGSVSNTSFQRNHAVSFGGGLHMTRGTVHSSAFIGNSGSAGGGLFMSGGPGSMVDRTTFISNSTHAPLNQGGVMMWHSGTGTVRNSLFTWNQAAHGGGLSVWIASPNIYNITVTRNSSGARFENATSRVLNSIIAENYGYETSVDNSDVTLTPSIAYTMVSGDPHFRDVSRGDFRLRWDSPVINAGTNLVELLGSTDLDGKPRIVDGIVDYGAFEAFPPDWDEDGDGLPDEWEWLHFGGATNASPNTLGADGRLTNWEHHVAGTDPHDPSARMHFEQVEVDNTDGGRIALHWDSYPDRLYTLYRGSDLLNDLLTPIAVNIPAEPPRNTYTDHDATGSGPWIYRLGVSLSE